MLNFGASKPRVGGGPGPRAPPPDLHLILDWWQWCSTENVSRMYRYFNVPFSKERTVDCFAATRWELNFCALLVSKPKGNSDISKVFVDDAVCR